METRPVRTRMNTAIGVWKAMPKTSIKIVTKDTYFCRVQSLATLTASPKLRKKIESVTGDDEQEEQSTQ